MIKIEELLKGVKLDSIPKQHQDNLVVLLQKLNVIREKYGKPLTVTSGYRSKEDQIRIYKAKGIPESKIPWGSGHLKGECGDISDPNGDLRQWCLKNLQLLKTVGLWMEDFRYTKGWVHFGIKPPSSGKRIFVPFNSPPPYPDLWDGKYDSQYD